MAEHGEACRAWGKNLTKRGVFHDYAFLENLALTDRLLATEQGLHLEPQSS